MNVLWMTSSLPYPPVTGGKIRVWNLLQCVAQQHQVTLLSLLDSPDEVQFLSCLTPYCAQVEAVVKRRRRPRGQLLLRLLRTMLKGQPPRNGIAHYEEFRQKLEEITGSQAFDIIQIEQSYMAPYIEFAARADHAVRLVTLYDVGATQYERILRIQSSLPSRLETWLNWLFLRRWEPTYLARHFDKCIVVSPADQALLRQANPALDLAIVPNGVNTAQYNLLPESSGSKEILLIGKMNYAPNADAALFFRHEVLPLVQRQVPQARLLIVGPDPSPEIRALSADPAVTVTGYVKDIMPYYQRACLSATPLRAGGGTRLKILESMAVGRPVVSTSLGSEGLEVTHGDNILIADSPADLAEQTVRLLCDPALRQRLVTSGRQLVETMYDWQVIARQLLQVYDLARRQKSDHK